MQALGYPQGETLDLPKGPQILSRHKIRFNAFGGGEFATKTIQGFKFVVVPQGFRFYKGMPTRSNTGRFFSTKTNPFPSYYADEATAQWYVDNWFPGNTGRIFEFEAKRDLVLFLFSDEDNVELLGEKLADPSMNTQCQVSVLKERQRDGPAAQRELLFAAGFKGLGFGCENQEAFRDDFVKVDPEAAKDPYYNYSPEKCAAIQDREQHRFSIAPVDDQVSRNLCCAMAELGIPCDGYIADRTATAWGEMAPDFHEELMVCFFPDSMQLVL